MSPTGIYARRSSDPKARFMSYVNQTEDCWEWRGSAHGSDRRYGGFTLNGRRQYAHRVAYQLFVGPIPEGLELDHLCRNRWCVRPDHLEPVTHQENMRRGQGWAGRNARKVVCDRHGNALTGRNGVGRFCRECRREDNTAYRRRLGVSTASERSQRMWASRTPEERAEISRKIWATRHARAGVA